MGTYNDLFKKDVVLHTKEDDLITDVCCSFCVHVGSRECPVSDAHNWSQYQAFCFKFENLDGKKITGVMTEKDK